MPRPAAFIKKSLIFLHRWIGVALCLLFAMWFASGIVLMYWDFPSVSAEDRLQRSPALDPSTIRLSPAEAAAGLDLEQAASRVRLNTFDARPVYRFTTDRGDRIVYADSGEEQVLVSPEMAQRIASAWTSQPAARAKQEFIEEPDQWTVQESLRELMPLWKYSWPNGDQVYVSDATGEVVQYTTSATRFWACLGAIPHWLYFTPLRKHGAEWSRLVIWASGIGAITAILGIAVGLWMYSPAQRYSNAGHPTSIPYRGQKRWHTILGLIFGIGAVTWAFSGMLSLNPFPTAAGDSKRVDISAALRGRLQLEAFQTKDPREALKQFNTGPVKELELTALDGDPIYIATLARRETRIVPVSGDAITSIDPNRIIEVVKAIRPEAVAEVRVLDGYDAYYLDRRHELPLPVVLVTLNDAAHTRYYIDPKTTRIAGIYSSRAWMERWLYHGLHSLDFPWLYKYRPLWDIVMISFMLGGSALSVTSLILAWRVLLRLVTA
jgi:PepSY-associated transmembrane protein